MYGVILTLHVVVCFLVILVVLIQSGRGAGLSNVFGGGGGDALFSAPSGSQFIRKLTTGLAVGFFMTSLVLTYLSARTGWRSVTRGEWSPGPFRQAPPAAPSESAPAAPQTPPAAPQGQPRQR